VYVYKGRGRFPCTMHAVRMKAVWGAQFREFFVMAIGNA
jgi:hypothetical protein